MKIQCGSAELAKACMNVQRTVSNKSTIPALEGILLDAKDGMVSLTGYDLEVGSIAKVEADISSEGKIVLNAKNLCDILRMIPGDTVSIDCDERNISKIKSEETEYSLIGTSADDYPDLPTVNKYTSITLELGTLKDMIKKTIFSVSTSERNPVHTGVKFEISGGKIVLVAVDGARLAIRRENVDFMYDSEDAAEKMLEFVVPAKTLNEILKLGGEDDTQIVIYIGDRHIVFKYKEYEIISRLLEGKFIDYKAAIPMTHSTRIIVPTRSLIECIERTSLIITDKSSPVRCVIENGIMKFSSVTAIGTASDKLAADIEGNNLEIGFNNRFVLDALKVCDCDEIKIEMGSSNQPIIITPLEGDSFFFLILPIRI
ncbi:MAG: DNA polymerase III subunit beta [Clostridia bacterium]|nr:DNA polymerase III subunit beta [Clostridia bacterium]MBQ7296654.1 DNA polymerase III subunit beta [Clostridia bacterium]